MNKISTPDRRTFLRQLSLLAGAAPMIIPSRARGAGANNAPNDRITIGAIGLGKQGSWLLRGFLNISQAQIVAVCDVDRLKLQRGQKQVNDHYSALYGREYRGCDAYSDFREIIARKDIDAVLIATPDHWHAIPSIMAAQAGKDIYGEKPLSLTLGEARQMVNAVRRNGRVFQTGAMQRSSGHFRFACELVRNGYIGEVKRVRVSIGTGFEPHPVFCDLPAGPKPQELDWDFWLGQAPKRPYNSIIAPPISFNGFPAWRNYRDYSGGGMTDWGAHHFDIAQWGLGMDAGGPVEVTPAHLSPYKLLTYRYATGVELTTDFESNFIRFTGTKGEVQVNRGYLRTKPQSLLSQKIAANEIHLYESSNHYVDFLNAVRTRSRPISDVEIGARSVTVCHLGNLAQQLGRTLHWDPKKEEFINDEHANRMRFRSMRSPWRL